MPHHDIVVVGASAGGVRALRVLAAGLPPSLRAAVCVLIHVERHASSLPDILSAAGPLPASHALHGQPLERGRIHVARPDHHLLVGDDNLQVLRGAKEHHTRPAIDPLFRSAALAAGPRGWWRCPRPRRRRPRLARWCWSRWQGPEDRTR